MLTDTQLRHLKPKDKLYKINDRDGFYVAVTPTGSISFRYNYTFNNRQETVVFGRYGTHVHSLADAREKLTEAKRMIATGNPQPKKRHATNPATKRLKLLAIGQRNG